MTDDDIAVMAFRAAKACPTIYAAVPNSEVKAFAHAIIAQVAAPVQEPSAEWINAVAKEFCVSYSTAKETIDTVMEAKPAHLAAPTEQQITALLHSLDFFARGFDSEYGLPMAFEDQVSQMHALVRLALSRQPGNDA